MNEERIHTLIESVNSGSGRLTLDDKRGPEITSGQSVELWFAGRWIPGKIVESSWSNTGHIGRYFMAEDDSDSVCGLCARMKIRLR